MWPWTTEENHFLSENKKTMESYTYKMRSIASDVTDMQLELATKMFGLVNKHTNNFFGIYENVFNKQVTEYRNNVRTFCKE